MNTDFGIENRLKTLDPDLHRIFTNSVLCCQNMLQRYSVLFPNYTDHTALHSLEVIDFCNQLIGENVKKLNADELFVLLMAAYLHDSGMGISHEDLEEFSPGLPIAEFEKKYPEMTLEDVVRTFHHELSGLYIKKYAAFFELPSPQHTFAVIQVARGHRKTDLYDEKEYPSALEMPNGNTVCVPYLAALIRLADELDVAADRNMTFLYDISSIDDELSVMEFMKHKAIRHLRIEEDRFVVEVDGSDDKVFVAVVNMCKKVLRTVQQCADVVEKRTPYRIRQTQVEIARL